MIKEIKLPALGEGIQNGTIVNLLIKKGEWIAAGKTLIEVETDKVTIEIPSDLDGYIHEVYVKSGDKIKPGDVIAGVEISRNRLSEMVDSTNSFNNTVSKNDGLAQEISANIKNPENSFLGYHLSEGIKKPTIASPLARKLARELGVDIQDVKNNAGISRISVQSIKEFVKNNRKAPDIQSTLHLPESLLLSNFDKYGLNRKENMTGIAIATAKNMTQSWSSIPHAWVQEKADITELEKIRKQFKKDFQDKGISITITAFIVKTITASLKKHPLINCSIDIDSYTIVYKDFYNIGVAVDTERGLLVPVVKNADKLSLNKIADELNRLSTDARERKTKMEDLEGATFTISNLGSIGTTAIFPLVSFPQAAILGVGGSNMEPGWMNNEWQPRLVMPLTLGFDHRIINGADAAKFLKTIKSYLENPYKLLL
jgi:pyruvate dehydrogenase E2 component (dihydrolipoamide acetyltransferase)